LIEEAYCVLRNIEEITNSLPKRADKSEEWHSQRLLSGKVLARIFATLQKRLFTDEEVENFSELVLSWGQLVVSVYASFFL
jgi:hypothetical protein